MKTIRDLAEALVAFLDTHTESADLKDFAMREAQLILDVRHAERLSAKGSAPGERL